MKTATQTIKGPVTLENVTFDRLGGKKITMPNMGIDEAEAIKRYAAGSLVNQAKGYYEKQGMEIPDFDRMDKIEKLEALETFRDMLRESKEKLKQLQIDGKNRKLEADRKAAEASKKGHQAGNNRDRVDDVGRDTLSPGDSK